MCNNSFLTHPESGAQVGTRLHKSLMIRMTTTAELRLLTLAWRHKEKPVQSEELQPLTPCSLLHKTTQKNKAKKGQNDWAIPQTHIIAHFCPQAVCCLSTETTFHNGSGVDIELSPTVDILITQIMSSHSEQWNVQICHCFGSVDHFLWVSKYNSYISNILRLWDYIDNNWEHS